MLQPSSFQLPSARRLARICRRWQVALLWLCILSLTAHAQGNFVSGSTGADGAFSPTQSQTLQLPESGVFNFTTINIPAGVTIRFGRNSRNMPVTILATGNVTIAGLIDISGSLGATALGGVGGPGGFNGGAGGPNGSLINNAYQNLPGANGDGPGGGGGGGSAATQDKHGTGGGGGFANPGQPGNYPLNDVTNAAGGPKYGLSTLLPLIGGSGGGGETGSSTAGAGGGGGGGALLLASSGTISFTDNFQDQIAAGGGNGNRITVGSGGGSGGAVRLIANTISGSLRINAGGGFGSGNGGSGGGGYVRIEAFDLTALTVNLSNQSTAPRVTTATPGVVVPANLPSIRIVSVAGIAPPTKPSGSLQGGPDIILPSNQSNPVNVALSASNIPLGTTLQVTLTPENGARVATQSTSLTGTLASSTATASVSLPDGISVIQAAGTIDVAGTQLTASNGEKVKRIEVSATYGGRSTVTYITESGKRISAGQ